MTEESGSLRWAPAALRAVEWLSFALLSANLLWSTLCLGGYRPETQVVTYGLTAAAVFVRLAATTSAGLLRVAEGGGLFFLGFLAYAAGNAAFVGTVPWLGWIDVLGWAQLFGVFWLVQSGFEDAFVRRSLYGLLIVLSVVSVGLACHQRFSDPGWLMLGRHQLEQYEGRASGPFGIPNSLAGLLVLLLPSAALAAWDRSLGWFFRILAGYVGGLLLFGLFLTMSRGAWLSLVLALVLTALLSGRATLKRRLGSALAIAFAALAAVALLYAVSSGVKKRIDALASDGGERTRPVLWSVAWRIFEEHPLFGGGGGSYNVLFERHRPEACQREPQWAHNEYLNTLADYGAVGFLLVALGAAVVCCRRRASAPSQDGNRELPSEIRRGLAIGLAAFCLQLLFDFHLKIPALALAFATAAGLVFVRPAEQYERKAGAAWRLLRVVPPLLALGLAAVFVLFFRPLLKAEALRYSVRERLDELARKPESAGAEELLLADCERDLREAVRLCPSHGYAWSELSYVNSLQARLRPGEQPRLGRASETAARIALETSSGVAEFWVRLGVSQDIQGRWLEAGESFTEAQRLAPASANVIYYLAFHYSLRRNTVEQARSLVAICLRLDPSHGPAQLLRSRLATETSHR